MFRLTVIVAALTTPVMGVYTAAGATVLLHDSFDGPDDAENLTGLPHDVNLNSDLHGRQAGSALGTLAYRLDVGGGSNPPYTNPYISGNALVLKAGSLSAGVNRSQIIAADHDLVDPAITDDGGFVVEFTVNPTGGNTSSDWFGVSLGHTSDSVANAYAYYTEVNDPEVDFGILFRGNGGYSTFGDGTFHGETGSFASGHGPDEFFDVRIEVETDSFASGESATVRALVNGQQLDISTAVGDELTFLWDQDQSNYISLESRVMPSAIDDLTISTIPEPSALALLCSAIIGLVAYVRRKRGR